MSIIAIIFMIVFLVILISAISFFLYKSLTSEH